MTLRLKIVALSAAAAGAAGLIGVPTAVAADGGRPITVEMTGAQEAPGPGDPDGSGTATFAVNVGQSEVCYTITVADIDPATAAHVHRALPGIAGPVVIPLAAPTSGSSSGCATVPRALALELIKSPGDFYVNVHNPAYPAGAVRGQLG
ncbi:MAG: CHRD domain-containing protein [Knoellia sp.]